MDEAGTGKVDVVVHAICKEKFNLATMYKGARPSARFFFDKALFTEKE